MSEERLLTRERSDVADLHKYLSKTTPQFQRSSSFDDALHQSISSPQYERNRRLREPGGFRRDFLHTRADNEGLSLEHRPSVWSLRFLDKFMDLPMADIFECKFGSSALESPEGDASHRLSNIGVAIAIFKGNCGFAILLMPHGWKNGGYLLSTLLLPLVCFTTTWAATRLLACRKNYGGSYGDLMERSTGKFGRLAVNISVVLLQTGLCCSYLICVAQILQRTILPSLSVGIIIIFEMLFQIPLVLIRKMSNLWVTNLLGTILVIGGVMVIIGVESHELATLGISEESVEPMNNQWLIFLGTALFAFEGIGIVVPIYDSTSDPESFVLVYSVTMAAITLMICLVGLLGYLSYGGLVSTVVLMELPSGFLRAGLQLAFGFAMLSTFPLQMLPGLLVMESRLFKKRLQPAFPDNCQKNCFRIAFLVLTAAVAIVGSTSLDHFVSLVGAIGGLPLGLVYPAMCHWRLATHGNLGQKLIDAGLVLVGLVFTVIITALDILKWGAV